MKHLAQIQAEFLKLAMNWRDRFVWHITPTGQRNRVKIRSLSLQEQEKYKPAYEKIDKIIQAGVVGSNLLKTLSNFANDMTPAAKATFAKTIKSVYDMIKNDAETYRKMIRDQLMNLREKNDYRIIELKKAKLNAKTYGNKNKLHNLIIRALCDRKKFDELIRHVPAPKIKEPQIPVEQFDLMTNDNNMKRILANRKDEISNAIDQWAAATSPEIVDKKNYMILADVY